MLSWHTTKSDGHRPLVLLVLFGDKFSFVSRPFVKESFYERLAQSDLAVVPVRRSNLFKHDSVSAMQYDLGVVLVKRLTGSPYGLIKAG